MLLALSTAAIICVMPPECVQVMAVNHVPDEARVAVTCRVNAPHLSNVVVVNIPAPDISPTRITVQVRAAITVPRCVIDNR